MPDPRWRLRRLFEAGPVRRGVTHLLVIVLVVASAATGIAATGAGTRLASSLDLVSRARGAAGQELPVGLQSVTYELTPDPANPDPMLQRRIVRFEPDPTPLPTPVAPPTPAPTPVPRPVAKPQVVTGNGQLLWPVHGVITTYYSASHLAIDIAAPAGTSVVASDAGTVTWAGWRNNGGGLVVVIDHGNGMQTAYNHLGVIDVAVGQAVARGEHIGQVGCTGNCTGPHVHFEVVVGGTIVNPLRYL